ncbi:unnamed protein product, partial [Rhizoctonia solani]
MAHMEPNQVPRQTLDRVRGLRPNSEDELQNVNMTEEEENKKRHELKNKRRNYMGYYDEFVSGQAGMKRA